MANSTPLETRRLDERVISLEERFGSLRSSIESLASTTAATLTGIQAQIQSLAGEVRLNQRTPWATLISGALLLLAFAGGLATTTLGPIYSNIGENKHNIETLATTVAALKDVMVDRFANLSAGFVTREEATVARGRAVEDRANIEKELDHRITRDEFTAVNDGIAQRFEDAARRMDALSARLNQVQ